jgi:transmembrane sensor
LFDEQDLLQRIHAQIGQVEPRAEVPVFHLPSRKWWYASGLAASILLVLGVFYLLTPQASLDSSPVASAPNWVEHTNTSKKIERYRLPDQSTVWLHPGARLSHPTAFDPAAQREVRFLGEGFFDVARDTLHPFVIYSGELKTQVLGTSFNVRAYENDPSYHVSVVTGSVAVSTSASQKAETLVLKPNEQATFQSTTQRLTLEKINSTEAQKETWQPVSLVFDDTPLSEVVVRLQRTFRVKIELTNPELNKCRLKVDFNNQRLPEILEMINTLLGTTYELEGGKIRLSGEGCTG